MKKSIISITTITIVFAFTALSCDSSPDRMERAQTSVIEAERDLDIAQAEIESEVRIYRQETANDIRENNMAIAVIKVRIENEEGEAKATYKKRIADLERNNVNLKREIDNYRVTNSDHWNDFKQNFSSSMDDLGNSLDDFFPITTTSI